MEFEMLGQDLYLRHTAGNGASYIAEHRVYDAEKFLNSCQAACNKVNAEEKDPRNRQAAVTLASREAYQREHWKT